MDTKPKPLREMWNESIQQWRKGRSLAKREARQASRDGVPWWRIAVFHIFSFILHFSGALFLLILGLTTKVLSLALHIPLLVLNTVGWILYEEERRARSMRLELLELVGEFQVDMSTEEVLVECAEHLRWYELMALITTCKEYMKIMEDIEGAVEQVSPENLLKTEIDMVQDLFVDEYFRFVKSLSSIEVEDDQPSLRALRAKKYLGLLSEEDQQDFKMRLKAWEENCQKRVSDPLTWALRKQANRRLLEKVNIIKKPDVS